MSNLNPEVLAELRQGNVEALKNLPPLVAMQYGLQLREEQEKEQSPISDKGLAEAMLNRIKDTGIKEQIIKAMEEQEKATD
ncbi:hypothetical protein L8956_04125 [Peribacillus frigoritolerans]|uniref:hypothetical protein n=1 Tax=Peribacillus frigoritolerans TaxID=450367 RepID=UPI001EFD641E|nr:hypothetical protein [Peribacillus frigoritolerans]ULM97925.1 hypothetical protein L8956_04125 [Peribacillus frigoritolerans]